MGSGAWEEMAVHGQECGFSWSRQWFGGAGGCHDRTQRPRKSTPLTSASTATLPNGTSAVRSVLVLVVDSAEGVSNSLLHVRQTC